MSGIVVVYELDHPVAGSVHRVHAAPTTPGGGSERGPRTMCGKDTFAMETADWKPADHPDAWCPPEYADAVCPGCEAVMGED
ncbi:hypothetical protein ACFVX6_09230 [Streptomyces sp. NPDC058289]|uniref:hypothetical protein n=1 Tax=Streptomyces sp. NPDC058289 TaxID=3346425 RepID=UPI0036E400DD